MDHEDHLQTVQKQIEALGFETNSLAEVVDQVRFNTVLISFATFATDVSLTERLVPGIVFHDYAVQGMTFSLAAIACIAALMRPADFAGGRLLGNRVVTAVILVLLVVDVVFVLWGRTGAAAIVLMSTSTVALLIEGAWRRRAFRPGMRNPSRPELRRSSAPVIFWRIAAVP